MKLLRFIVTGASAAFVELAIFFLLHSLLSISYLAVSQSASFLAGFVVSFVLNRTWVFKSKSPIGQELAKYLTLLAINLIITNILIAQMINSLKVDYWLAKLVIMAMVATWNYFLFQKLIFNGKNSKT